MHAERNHLIGKDRSCIVEASFCNFDLEICLGSALEILCDRSALVNAANEQLSHGAGIAGQIVTSGGPSIQEESYKYVRDHGHLKTTEVCRTRAGTLPFEFILHAVGPRCNSAKASLSEWEQLVCTVRNAIKLAESLHIENLVCPIISSGIFGFPVEDAVYCHLQAYVIFAQERDPDSSLKKLIFACFTKKSSIL